jgi:hypothetical protein
VVCAEVAHRASRPRAAAVPGLARRIAIAHEQDVLALRPAGHEHRDGLGLGEAGEIEKIAVRPVGVLDVVVAQPDGRRRHDGDGVSPHELHQRAAAPAEFVAPDRGHAG